MKTPTAMKAGRTLALALAVSLPAAARADGFKSMAKQLTKAAQRAKIERIAVLTFEPADATDPKEGWSIAEKLTTQIVRQDRVQAIERNLMRKVMEEGLLGATGAVELPELRRVGRVLAVEALVTGSFASAGDQTIVDARLIDARTGAIIAAVEGRAGRASRSSRVPYAFGGADGEAPLLPPPIPASFRELASEPELRDSLAQEGCADAAERVDRLEAGILDLKARYWASRLRGGLSLSSLRHNPGSTITDPLLKRKLYDRMKDWYALSSIPPMSVSEVELFTSVDQKALRLHRECGL